MQRAFAIDVLACPSCGGRLRLITAIVGPRTIRAMLLSLGGCLQRRPIAPHPPPGARYGRSRAGRPGLIFFVHPRRPDVGPRPERLA
jgi:hypothetical protein